MRDLALDPLTEDPDAFLTQVLAVALEQVGPFVRPALDIIFAAQQFTHDLLAFLLAGRFIGKEGADFFHLRRQSRQIQIDPAQKLGIGANVRRKNLHLLELCVDVVVNKIILGNLRPLKSASVAHDGDLVGGIQALIANQNGSLAAADGFDQPILHFRHVPVVAGENGFTGHIAHRAIAVMSQHEHLLLLAWQVQGHFGRDDFQLLGAPDLSLLGFYSFDNPLAQQLILLGARLDRLAAFVRHFARGLEQHQALIDRDSIETATGQIVHQRLIIEVRIIPAQRQFESVLAFGRAMTCSRIATGFADERLDVAHEANRRHHCIFDVDGQCGPLAASGHHHISFSLCFRADVSLGIDIQVG